MIRDYYQTLYPEEFEDVEVFKEMYTYSKASVGGYGKDSQEKQWQGMV